jgi:hypothetical protein
MGRVMLLSLTRVSRASLQKWTIKNNWTKTDINFCL